MDDCEEKEIDGDFGAEEEEDVCEKEGEDEMLSKTDIGRGIEEGVGELEGG